MEIDFTLFAAFVAVSTGLIIVPGPNVLLIISTSVSSGSRRGLQTAIGTSSAIAIQLTVATLGMTTLMVALSTWLEWVRWAGVAYLLYLGVQQWRASFHEREVRDTPPLSSQRAFWRGFFVSMTNPKSVFFFGAFLPQFVDPARPVPFQMLVLSFTFLVLATVLDSSYALLSGRLHGLAKRPKLQRFGQRFSGTLFLGAGTGLALTR
jgi:homoserine/homoserine lactone efflux protein